MIASLDGTVGAVSADSLVVEVGGIGYRVFAAPSFLATATPGSRLKVHTYHLVREDQQALYGFATSGELGFFTLLLTVQGVGPKVALAIVGSRHVADLQLAIVQDDQAVLVSVPGVGKRLAGRICLELKEKVDAAGVAAVGAGGAAAGTDASRESEVVAALQALGYSLQEARSAARRGAVAVEPGASLEDRVKAALTATAVD
jgi:Holliday junction DNA helicase RuvA